MDSIFTYEVQTWAQRKKCMHNQKLKSKGKKDRRTNEDRIQIYPGRSGNIEMGDLMVTLRWNPILI